MGGMMLTEVGVGTKRYKNGWLPLKNSHLCVWTLKIFNSGAGLMFDGLSLCLLASVNGFQRC